MTLIRRDQKRLDFVVAHLLQTRTVVTDKWLARREKTAGTEIRGELLIAVLEDERQREEQKIPEKQQCQNS